MDYNNKKKTILTIFSITTVFAVLLIPIIAVSTTPHVVYAVPAMISPEYQYRNPDPKVVKILPDQPIPDSVGPSGYMCDTGTTDDLLWTLIDANNNTIKLWCKHVPSQSPGIEVSSNERQFVGYWNDAYVIGFCPFTRGMNTWHWYFGEHNELVRSEWISRALNGTTVSFGFSWNETAPTPQL